MIGMLVSVFVGCCFAGCLYFIVAVCWQLPAWLQVRRVLLVVVWVMVQCDCWHLSVASIVG